MTQTLTRFQALEAVANHFKTQQEMADAFGVSQPTIWRWMNQSKQMPAEYVLRAEEMTGVPRHLIRPDIYPLNLPPPAWWIGYDPGSDHGDAVAVTIKRRNGNRTHVLDTNSLRRAAR